MAFFRIAATFILLLITSSVPSRGADCPSADLNGDCTVDLADLVIFGSQWLDNSGGSADLDGNPGVTLTDFAILADHWLQRGRADCPLADLNGDCTVDLADLVIFASQWLDNSGGSADLDDNPGVTLTDFAILADHWLHRGRLVTVVINEFMADNNEYFYDNAGEDDDWIEIYNYGSRSVDIGGMIISDEMDSLTPWKIPANYPEQTTIPAGEFLILWADDESSEGPLHIGFKLAAGGGEDIALFDSNQRLIDSILDFGPQAENNSFGRFPDAGTEWVTFVHDTETPPTPGWTNGGSLPEDAIVITEIMYHPYNAAHPLVEDIREEYIELYNRGFSDVNLKSWRISNGVDFTFPDAVLGAGDYLVVAADMTIFSAKYPSVNNVIGGWDGRLSNSGEIIELTAVGGKVVDTIRYADQGDWAQRILGPLDHNHRGWMWSDDHDGKGKSLELTCMGLPNEYGSNWGASITNHGTPGRINSTDIGTREGGAAPLILEAQHTPIIPRSTDTVSVTAHVIDEEILGVIVSLHYRGDGQSAFASVSMFDNGLNGDKQAGDGIFTAQIPAYSHNTVVEFYVEASDSSSNARTSPAPSSIDGSLNQSCNMLYQVDDTFDAKVPWKPGNQPVYRIIMTEVQRAELDRIGSTSGDADSDAQMHATFISVDGIETNLRYNAGVRNRGHGTRTSRPNNYRVSFPNDRPWKGVVDINLNTQYTWLQLAGSAIFQRSGLATGDAKAVQVRVNGQNLAHSGSPQYGSYAHIEAINSDYADHQFPDNGAGNAYKCMRATAEADLRYLGEDTAAYRPNYFKETNESYDDWTDLIELTRILSSNTPEDQYVQEVNRVVNVDQWLRFLALNVLLDNSETSLANGDGDDYFLYRGGLDRRFVLIQHDLDSIFGQGQDIGSATAEIFPFMSGASGENAVAALKRMVSHPDFASRYYGHLKDLIETNLSAAQLEPFLDNFLSSFVPQQTIDSMKTWQAARNVHVLSLIPSDLTIATALPMVDGYNQTTENAAALSGHSDAVKTRSVRVNGLPALWSAIDARWSIGSGSASVTEEMIIPRGSFWRYLDNGSNQTDLWIAMDYDESGWKGPQATRLGFGGDDETSPVVTYIDTDPSTSGTQKNVTTYFRRKFTVDDPSKYSSLRIGLVRDDGAAVYLNGEPLFTSNLSTTPLTYTTLADKTINDPEEQVFYNYTVESSRLNSGTNIIAVEVHQSVVTSSDLGFNLELAGILKSSSNVTGVPLVPGINRITVQAFDGPEGTGNEIDREYIDVWQNHATFNLSGSLTQDTILEAASGPYTIVNDLIVPDGIELTIMPGTTLFFTGDTGLIVNGQLLAEGTEFQHIRLTRVPGDTNWNGIRFEYPSESPPRPTALRQNNRLVYVDMEYCDADGHAIFADNANVDIENVIWINHNDTYLDFSDSSILVRNCIFPSITDSELVHYWGFPSDGYALFEGNTFGSTTGYNDIIDLTGGKLPGPISHFINNTFLGGSDDGIDLDASDAYVEGNVFMHFHQDAPRESLSHAVSTGTEYGQVSNITVIRNLIYDVDHAFLIKDGSFAWIENNTVVHATLGVANFFEDRSGQWPGIGAYFDGNIFYDVAANFINLNADGTVTDLTVNRSIIPGTSPWPGISNSTADPCLTNTTHVTDPRTDFALVSGSPAISAGPNGLDMGGLVPGGATITGEPDPITNLTSAELTVDGPGITHYQYKINDDPWSTVFSVDTPIRLSDLPNGQTFTISVIGKNFANDWQSKMEATRSQSWTVNTEYSNLRINEILADNHASLNLRGAFPDLIELYYEGPTSLPLDGMSITDNPAEPGRYVFPAGTVIHPNQQLVLYADSIVMPGEIHLGFALDNRGDGVYLYDQNGQLVDSVVFGVQIPDLSIGCDRTGKWQLMVPTFGDGNILQPVGDRSAICINEWLTYGQISFIDDFVELYNPTDSPIDLSNLYITDNPVSQPEKYQIGPLNFIPAKGYAVFDADAQNQSGHVPFRLSSEQGMVALFESDNHEIDWVVYGPQSTDISQGCWPDAADTISFFDIPTPGTANPKGQAIVKTTTTILPENASKKIWIPTAEVDSAWKGGLVFDDSAWTHGVAVAGKAGGVGYETKPGDTVNFTDLISYDVSAMRGHTGSCYIRIAFTLTAEQVASLTNLTLRIRNDDAFVAYVNGIKVAQSDRVPTTLAWNSDATGNTSSDSTAKQLADYVVIDQAVLGTLKVGENILAVHAMDASGSTDFVLSFILDITTEITEGDDNNLAEQRANLNGLRITELMYNPLGSSDLEYIELQNVGTEVLDVMGVRLDDGITFTFPEMTLAEDEYVVVVNNIAAFQAKYGDSIRIAGEYEGNLSNGGESIVLRLPDPLQAAILRIEYSDMWYPTTDGDGYALVIRDAMADRDMWNRSVGWSAGAVIGGSPGTSD